MLIKQIEKLAEKKRWMEKFRRAYKGEMLPDTSEYYSNNVIFLVAQEEDKELGFIRINNKTSFFKEHIVEPVWNLTDGYVKPPYRSKSVLKELIKHSIQHHNVKMMLIETARFQKNQRYYYDLGFVRAYSVRSGLLTWAFQEDIWPVVEKLNRIEPRANQ